MKKNLVCNVAELPLILTVENVSNILGISRVGAYELVKTESFPSIRIGRRITVPRDSFVQWLEKESFRRE